MGVITILAETLGVGKKTTWQPRDPSGNEPAKPVSPTSEHRPPGGGTYASLEQAITAGFSRFLEDELLPVRHIDPRACAFVRHIYITPKDVPAHNILQKLFQRIKRDRLVGWMQSLVRSLPDGDAYVFDQFKGITAVSEFDHSKKDDSHADSLAELRAELSEKAANVPDDNLPYSVWFDVDFGSLDDRKPLPPHSPPPPWSDVAELPKAPSPTGGVSWQVMDADGTREVGILCDVRSVVGRATDIALSVNGTHASGYHGEIWYERGGWWYRDLGSTNGSRVIGTDGRERKVFPGKAGGSAAEPIDIRPGERIILAATASGPAGVYPIIGLPVGAGRSAGATPLAGATPIAQAQADAGASSKNRRPRNATASAPQQAILRLVDTLENKSIPLTGGLLPFSIGRARRQSLVVPAQHASVSAAHLEILEITKKGARVRMKGKNGGLLEGAECPASNKPFIWAFGQTLTLGDPATDAPAPEFNLRLEQTSE